MISATRALMRRRAMKKLVATYGSQRRLGAAIGCSQVYVSQIVTGAKVLGDVAAARIVGRLLMRGNRSATLTWMNTGGVRS